MQSIDKLPAGCLWIGEEDRQLPSFSPAWNCDCRLETNVQDFSQA
ncbi:hypothetical protein [Pseudomonas sp. PDM16]|nr:hypothetical protein [Pseudomonas sp. PDM16]